MKNLTLKIKNYQEDVTYVTLPVRNDLTEEQIIQWGKAVKKDVSNVTKPMEGSPDVIRFENEDGIYNGSLKKLIGYER